LIKLVQQLQIIKFLWWYAGQVQQMLITQISLDNKLVMVQQVLMVQTSWSKCWFTARCFVQIFGQFAGQFTTNAYASNFMGNQAGYQATSANNSNFFGIVLVVRHKASNSNFLVIMLVVVQHLLIGQISLVKMLVM
jgi:hypothetical protein